MKRFFFILLSVSFLLACNQGANTPVAEEHQGHDHDTTVAGEAHGHEATGVPALNNGAKWKSDLNTNKNVEELKAIAVTFKEKQNPVVADYHEVANKLGEGLNKMINECKMKGPDHDALHVWLEPLLKENKELKTVTEAALGSATFKSIDSRLDAYQNYFELP